MVDLLHSPIYKLLIIMIHQAILRMLRVLLDEEFPVVTGLAGMSIAETHERFQKLGQACDITILPIIMLARALKYLTVLRHLHCARVGWKGIVQPTC